MPLGLPSLFLAVLILTTMFFENSATTECPFHPQGTIEDFSKDLRDRTSGSLLSVSKTSTVAEIILGECCRNRFSLREALSRLLAIKRHTLEVCSIFSPSNSSPFREKRCPKRLHVVNSSVNPSSLLSISFRIAPSSCWFLISGAAFSNEERNSFTMTSLILGDCEVVFERNRRNTL